MPTSHRTPSRLQWPYRFLLKLLPRHLRDEHQRELDDDLAATSPTVRAFALDIARASLAAHWDILRQDVTHALRQMRRSPTFTAVAGITLAIGIGGNVAFFTLVDGVLVRQLPFAGADRIVDLTEENLQRGMREFGISPANFRDLTRDSGLFATTAMYQSRSGTIRVGEHRERVPFSAVSGDFFRVFTDRPLLGRTLKPEDDVAGSGAVVLGYAFWNRVFGADRSVVGRELEVDGTLLRVVGVMPERFEFPNPTTGFWRPLALSEADFSTRGARSVQGVARVRGGVEIADVAATVARTALALATEYPKTNTGWSALLRELRAARVSGVRASLLLVWGAGALVLLIAVANVAGLFLTRAVARERELALRAALGARGSRIFRQLATEAVVLTIVSTTVGIGLAAITLDRIRPLASTFIPRMQEVAVDARAVSYAGVLALLTTLGLSLLTGLSGRGRRLWSALGTARSGTSRRRRRMQRAIVGGEVALATFVLVGGALVVRTLVGLLAPPMGFDAHNAFTFRVEPPWRATPGGTQAEAFAAIQSDRRRASEGYDALLARLGTLPGVRVAGAVNRLPLTGDWWTTEVRLPEQAKEDAGMPVYIRPVTPGYFAAMGTRIVRGRGVERTDAAGGELVLAVDAEFARRMWGTADPVGREVLMSGPPGQPLRARVVGEVESIHMDRLDRALRPTMYVAFAQASEGHYLNWGMDVIVRGGVRLNENDIGEAVRDIFPDALVFGGRTLEAIVARSTADRRFQLFVIGSFGVLALLLATVGVGGVFLLAVRERREELAVRLALGAAPSRLWWSVQRDGLSLTGRGALLGLVIAWLAGRVFSTVAYGVPVHDPESLVGAGMLVLVAAFLAAAIPATRAMRIDPVRAMRE